MVVRGMVDHHVHRGMEPDRAIREVIEALWEDVREMTNDANALGRKLSEQGHSEAYIRRRLDAFNIQIEFQFALLLQAEKLQRALGVAPHFRQSGESDGAAVTAADSS
jgi:hypothetical protein